VGGIELDKDSLGRVLVSGDDELSQLAQDINGMLAALEESQARFRDVERMAAIGETTAMVGHDLRNPLQVIVMTLDLIARKCDSIFVSRTPMPEELRSVKGMLEKIGDQTRYMNKIVSDLQDYTKPMEPRFTETDLRLLLRDTVSTIKIPEAVDVVEKFDVSSVMLLDQYLMRRMFSNLILNAVQAMPDGGLLSLKCYEADGAVYVSVGDTGEGIPEKNLERMFEPLFTTKAKGTGLGLPVSSRIVDIHGGDIVVESEVGMGTTFTVRLPFETCRPVGGPHDARGRGEEEVLLGYGQISRQDKEVHVTT